MEASKSTPYSTIFSHGWGPWFIIALGVTILAVLIPAYLMEESY
jgi:hypothetical protein